MKDDNAKRMQDIFAFTQNVVGQEECKDHGKTYNLIETPAGIVGSCPDCFKEKIHKEDHEIVLKTQENKEGWQIPFIRENEHVSEDLKQVTVSIYNPADETQEKAKKLAVEFVKGFDGINSLVLSGKSGNGKSHLAYAINKALRTRGYKTWFIKTRDLIALRNEQFKPNSRVTDERILRVVGSIDLLVLDDLGSEYQKINDKGNESWVSDFLYAILEARLNKSIVVTTNYVDDALEEKYGINGERIVSRMLDKSKRIRLQGEDYRRKEII